MKTKETQATTAIWASSLSLTFFWILNIFKEANAGVKNFLNFYPPVGPLLGLFLFSILLLLILLILRPVRFSNQKTAFWALILSSILFFCMTFPPIFEIFVDFMKF